MVKAAQKRAAFFCIRVVIMDLIADLHPIMLELLEQIPHYQPHKFIPTRKK